MKHFPANAKNIKLPASHHAASITPGILADSLEVMENYCLQKILLLQSSLEKLNVQDNAKEIIDICQQIKKEKLRLVQIVKRKADSQCRE